jgi:hypothetical protein
MADQIDASPPLQRRTRSALSVSLTPALHRAQEALRDVEKERRKEDLAVEESIKEVLAWPQTHRPKNTTNNYVPKQKEWRVSLFFPLLSILLFIYSFM